MATAIRSGVDPTGRTLSRAMPRYEMNDEEMAILINYRKQLSGDIDPGVNEQTIRFATIVTDGVTKTDREAMLSVLQANINIQNTQIRPHKRRSMKGPFYKTETYGAYRKLELDIWQLKGQ